MSLLRTLDLSGDLTAATWSKTSANGDLFKMTDPALGSLVYVADSSKMYYVGGGTGTISGAGRLFELPDAQLSASSPTASDTYTSIVPPPFRPSLVYLPTLSTLLLFGGTDDTQTGALVRNDSMILVSGEWQLLDGRTKPTPRWGSAIVYNPDTKTVLLFGGRGRPNSNANGFLDTWQFAY